MCASANSRMTTRMSTNAQKGCIAKGHAIAHLHLQMQSDMVKGHTIVHLYLTIPRSTGQALQACCQRLQLQSANIENKMCGASSTHRHYLLVWYRLCRKFGYVYLATWNDLPGRHTLPTGVAQAVAPLAKTPSTSLIGPYVPHANTTLPWPIPKIPQGRSLAHPQPTSPCSPLPLVAAMSPDVDKPATISEGRELRWKHDKDGNTCETGRAATVQEGRVESLVVRLPAELV
ncbi:hypothetical protein BV22DRAFT_1047118 [Leucogyrophana mollusca]|uniref:Uncharacterized protein n=1 Tax=Leucogyrophana mollusca TaxID=85980 RepID=A0ACB8BJ99_9AGAM|nr:hypothetical protein BV22DRAFT_1047118 [Leucogyrophana mollusca]